MKNDECSAVQCSRTVFQLKKSNDLVHMYMVGTYLPYIPTCIKATRSTPFTRELHMTQSVILPTPNIHTSVPT